jgi:hypothetical protein
MLSFKCYSCVVGRHGCSDPDCDCEHCSTELEVEAHLATLEFRRVQSRVLRHIDLSVLLGMTTLDSWLASTGDELAYDDYGIVILRGDK